MRKLALDLDGTLISCEPRQSAVLSAALVCRKANADLRKIWELKREGDSTRDALKKSGLKSTLAQSVADDWQRMIEEPVWLELDSVLPGVRETLDAMRAAGAQLWLMTARSRGEWAAQQLARLQLISSFHRVLIVSASEPIPAKAQALREMDADAFFGDTESDWGAARKAGVPFYAVSTGQRSARFLSAKGVEFIDRCLADSWRALALRSGRTHAV